MRSEDPIIWGKDLTKTIGTQTIVKGVNLDIPRGLIFGFVGPSGCGKTTTIRLLTGIYRASGGEVRVMGKLPTQFTRRDREKIGYMPQHFALYPDLTIEENMNFAASIYGVGFGRKRRISQLLQFTDLRDHKWKLARNTSGGMQRRLSLAATLVHKPKLLFLDEPTAGVDPVLRQKFWDYFSEIRQNGTTIFITTQYVAEAVNCDLVGLMVGGNLLAVDTPAGLRRSALGGEVVVLKTHNTIESAQIAMIDRLPFVRAKTKRTDENEIHVVVDEASTAIPALVEWCSENHLPVDSVQEYLSPFDDVFVAFIKKLSKDI